MSGESDAKEINESTSTGAFTVLQWMADEKPCDVGLVVLDVRRSLEIINGYLYSDDEMKDFDECESQLPDSAKMVKMVREVLSKLVKHMFHTRMAEVLVSNYSGGDEARLEMHNIYRKVDTLLKNASGNPDVNQQWNDFRVIFDVLQHDGTFSTSKTIEEKIEDATQRRQNMENILETEALKSLYMGNFGYKPGWVTEEENVEDGHTDEATSATLSQLWFEKQKKDAKKVALKWVSDSIGMSGLTNIIAKMESLVRSTGSDAKDDKCVEPGDSCEMKIFKDRLETFNERIPDYVPAESPVRSAVAAIDEILKNPPGVDNKLWKDLEKGHEFSKAHYQFPHADKFFKDAITILEYYFPSADREVKTFGIGEGVIYEACGASMNATIAAVHHDDAMPYYTILVDGSERSTEHSRLSRRCSGA